MKMKLTWSFLMAVACLCATTNLTAKTEAVDNGFYTAKDKEFYLTPEEMLFIRPGLEITLLDVTIPADMQPEVTYSITDPAGLPLDADGVYTPGDVDMRFTLANIPMGEEQKVRLAYERTSRNGTLTAMGDGVYKYKFDLVLASDLDTTHTLVLGFRRDLRDYGLNRYADNAIKTWVPSGLYDAIPRDVVTAPTCNRCHDQLLEHGRWQSPQACTNCHNPTRNTRFDILIHAVHSSGEAGGHDFSEIVYPTDDNDCQVCHMGGTPTPNFPLVANPAAVMVCDSTGLGQTTLSWNYTGPVEIKVRNASTPEGKLLAKASATGSVSTGKWIQDGTVFDLYDAGTMELVQSVPVNATVLGCSGNAPGADFYMGEDEDGDPIKIPYGEAGAQHTNWMDHTSRVVCGSCHEHADIDFAAGVGHVKQTTDSSCHFCHEAYNGVEFDLSVKGAHMPTFKSAQFPGVVFKFLGITDTDPGDKPTVTFKVFSKAGPLDPNAMNRLRFAITGPNEDFDVYIQETVNGKAVASGGNWTYTFATPLPGDAAGSFTIGVEGRDTVDINMGDKTSNERDVLQATSMAFAVTDASAKARRMVVDDALCESCHVNLSLHGGGRNNANYCNSCHMPAATDWEELQEGNKEQSIHFKYMIHSIHRGADKDKPYVAAGHNQSIHEYGEVEYPGNLANCNGCHLGDSYQVALPTGVLPTTTPQEWWDPMMPVAAACISCHDSDDAAAHAYANTTFFGESCGACHGVGKAAAVDKVHAN